MRFGVRVPAILPIRDVVAVVQAAEAAGVNMTQHSGSRLPHRLIETLGPLTQKFAGAA